ncbi:MAG: hypothetical protein CSA64_00340 [Arachnia propionica]|nr:MAG: hypothetical protein CSA64_00340 [Arachnia propionica]
MKRAWSWLLAVLLLPLLWFAPPAWADTDECLDIEIAGLSPAMIDPTQPDQRITLVGSVTNSCAVGVNYAAVNFWVDQAPIQSPSELSRALDDSGNASPGTRLPPYTEESGHAFVLSQQEPLAPGQRKNFAVHAKVGELELSTQRAAYFVGVHVRGMPADSEATTLGRAKVLLASSTELVPVSVAVKLAHRPTQQPTGEFLDSSLNAELEAELFELLELTRQPGVAALVDPLLVDELTALSEEHDLGREHHAGHPAAKEFLTQLRKLLAEGRLWRLPYADPDLAAAYQSGDMDQVLKLSERLSAKSAIAEAPLAIDLKDAATSDLVAALVEHNVTAVFAKNVASGHVRDIPVYGDVSLALRDIPKSDGTAAQREGRLLAEDLVTATPRVTLLRSPRELVLPQFHTYQPPQAPAAEATFLPPAEPQEYRELAEQIDAAIRRAGFVQDLIGLDASEQVSIASARARSSHFKSEAEAMRYFANSPATQIDANKVQLSTAGQFVMGSNTNNFPITISNGLDYPITVRAQFQSEVPQRIWVPATNLVTLEPGERKTLNISPEAASNSVVRVAAQLETRGGLQVGQPTTIEITATSFGRVGWIIIIISGAVVLGGTFLRIRSIQRDRGRKYQ